MMAVQFPNESLDYRAARATLLEAELELRQKTEDVAALRRQLPLGGKIPRDYEFTKPTGSPARISTLFGRHDTLAIYSLMYGPDAQAPCPMCAAFLDGLCGQISHLSSHMSIAVVAQNTPEKIRTLVGRMGWSDLNLHSSMGTSYQSDYLAEGQNGEQLPMLNVFQRKADGIYHFWGSEMFFEPSPWHPRHIDTIWPMWNILDLTPDGRGDHMPALREQ